MLFTSSIRLYYTLVIVSLFILCIHGIHNIKDYGGSTSTDREPDVRIALANSQALIKMITAANEDDYDRVAYVPPETYYFSAIEVDNLSNLIIEIDGILRAHSDIEEWPKDNGGTGLDEIIIRSSTNVTLRGKGVIDGQGYRWWWNSISQVLPNVTHGDLRGKMITVSESTNILVEGLTFLNSPTWHLNFEDCDNVTVRDFMIWVNVTSQKEMLEAAGLMIPHPSGPIGFGIPTFPLNTDGIDPAASNVHIYNGIIDNYDDAIVFKPCKNTMKYCTCSGGYVHDIKTVFSVGITIGSVPPRNENNCVKDVKFENIHMEYPLKGIYVKSNPGTSGTGLIQNITYENIYMYRPLWWALWIGPQQQHQPVSSCDIS